MRFSVRRILILAFNLTSTFLTLFTGLRENPLVVYVAGKYDSLRSRLIQGAINYDTIRSDLTRPGMLVDLAEVGRNYRFFSAPTRRFSNMGEDQNVCLRVNSINSSIINVYFDDFWGKGPRRTQIKLYSISPPSCDIVNLDPEWMTNCVEIHGGSPQCHHYIFDNFEDLRENRLAQTSILADFGKPGLPFLKCIGRPEKPFSFITDMIQFQNYWAGGGEFIQLFASQCIARPLIRTDDWKYSLFQVEAMNDESIVVNAIESNSWLGVVITSLYGVVSIALIVHGIFAAITQTKAVMYVPNSMRFIKDQKYLRYLLPTMFIPTTFPIEDSTVIQFKGSVLMGSDLWMNHWLYLTTSIFDAIFNIELTYVTFQTGTYMLSMHVNFENFIFTASAMTKMTWFMCFTHTLIRWMMKIVVQGLKSLRIIRPGLREQMDWYIDASTVFLSYKVYSIMLFVLLYFLLVVHGNTTFQVRQVPAKKGVFGGAPNLAKFWGNELTCDFFTILSIMLLIGYTVGTLLLFTKYKYVTNNSIIKLLQQRYIFVGWDALVAMEALGIDPMIPDRVIDGVALTNCSIGSLIREMYISGPSGLVTLAGDYLFERNGFSKEPVLFRYPVKKAIAMGLCYSTRDGRSTISSKIGVQFSKTAASYMKTTSVPSVTEGAEEALKQQTKTSQGTNKSIFERVLQVFTHGRYGQMLLIDDQEPGKLQKNAETGLTEYVVQDALSFIGILDIRPLLANEKKLRIK